MSYIGNPISIMDYPVDYFTGDGTSTTFQLSRIPASATSILVHIGGVKQVASTTDPAYYLDGSKLVFVSPPGAYSPIEVNYLGIAGQVNIPGVQSVTQDMLSLQLANTFVYQTTANGATASFTLNAPPVSANSLVVSANGVVQYDYSVNGNNLTFGFTPPVGTFIRVTSLALAQAGVPADGSVTSVKLGANLTITGNTTFDGFAGNPARIRGDWNNTTVANRVAFQTSNANQGTILSIIPNGSSQTAGLNFETDSAVTTGATLQTVVIGGSDARIASGIRGAGSYLPLTMYTGGSERMRIDTSGNVAIGVASSTFPLTVQSSSTIAAGSPAVVIQGQSNTERFHIRSAGAGGGQAVYLAASSRGTIASPTVTLNGDALGFYQLGGYNGTVFTRGAWISGLADGDWSGSNQGSSILFSTTANGSTTITERMRITSAGLVGIGISGPAGVLDVNGTGSGASTNWILLRAGNTGGTTFPGLAAGLAIGNNFSNGQSETNLVWGQSVGSQQYLSISKWTGSAVTEQMRITSGGRVAIGTTETGTEFNVYGTNNTPVSASSFWTPNLTGIVIRNLSNTSNTVSGITFQGGSSGNSISGIGNILESTSLGALAFFTGGQGVSSTVPERMRIDSAGRVTMPNQIAFRAFTGTTFTGSTVVIFGSTQFNTGGHYSTSTGRFTAPIAGRYFFTFYLLTAAGYTGPFWGGLRINGGTSLAFAEMDWNGQYRTITASTVVQLAAGDYVDVLLAQGQNYATGSGAGEWNAFSGYLIG